MAQDVSDPFADGPEGDPFNQPSSGGGSYPKPYDLFGELIMLYPEEVEVVPDNFNQGKTTKRLTATTVVITGECKGEYDSMWWSQSPIVKAGEVAIKRNQKAILGRLYRFPINEDKKAKKYQTREDIEAALVKHKPGQPNIRYAWALEAYSEEDAAIARAYLKA